VAMSSPYAPELTTLGLASSPVPNRSRGEKLEYKHGFTQGHAFFDEYGQVNDPYTKKQIMEERLKNLTSLEREYFEDWGGPDYMGFIEKQRNDHPICIRVDAAAFHNRDRPTDQWDEVARPAYDKRPTPSSGAGASAPVASAPVARPPPPQAEMYPRVHHDAVEWRWPPEDCEPLRQTGVPQGEVLPPLPPPRVTVSVMRVGHPPAVRVRIPRDAPMAAFKAEVAARVDINPTAPFKVTDQSGSVITLVDDLYDGELLYVEGAQVDHFRKLAREQQAPAPWSSGIRRSEPAWYVAAPAPVIRGPQQRRQTHQTRWAQAVSHDHAIQFHGR